MKRLIARSHLVRTTAAVGAGILLAVAIPLAASAHVTINPNSAPAGTYTLLQFRVPNESATATTTRLEVTLPTDKPFLSVSYVPVPGWTTKLVSSKLGTPVKAGDDEITNLVRKVIWTADKGAEIGAGQIQQFGLSLGPVPSVDSVALTAKQYYSDGSTVSWSEKGESAEHPAPVLFVNEAAPTPGRATSTVAPVAAPASAPASDSDVLARILGIAGLVAGAIGIVLAVAARRKRAE